jgi:pre-mRNA-splicing factor ISY1
MLYRFREAMLIESGVKRHPKDLRSLNPATCTSISIAESNRRDHLKEIHRKIGRIQDKELELSVVRTLNDEINDAIERIKVWDERIRELGGLSRRSQRRIEEFEAAAASSSTAEDSQGGESTAATTIQCDGKFFFGRAKELPEVQDILKNRQVLDRESLELAKLRKQRTEMYAKVNHIYYGLLDEDRESLVRSEEEVEFPDEVVEMEDSVDLLMLKEGLQVPSQEQVQEYLLDRRKNELIKRYT